MKVDCQVLSLWAVPLAWAVSLVNQIGPNAPTHQMILPKDSKDVIASILKFKSGLDMQKTRAENSLPFFYKRVGNIFITHFTALYKCSFYIIDICEQFV